jgi:tetratricopeptide (TPR) repeat protein
MFCSNCGKEILDNSKFCSHCGVEVGLNQLVPTNKNSRQEAEQIKAKGDEYLGQQNYKRAIEVYTQATKADSAFADVYNARGVCYFTLGEYEIAISDFDKAIEKNSEFWKPYVNRGRVHCAYKQYDLAISDFNNALRFDINNGYIYSQRAYAYYFINEYDKSLQDIEKAKKYNAPNIAEMDKLKESVIEGKRDTKVINALDAVGEVAKGFIGGVISGLLSDDEEDD